MNRTKVPDFRNLALLLFAALLASVYYGEIDYTDAQYATLDNSWYLRMAEAAPSLDPTVIQPFAFRILGPLLVGLLPFPEPDGFRALTVIFSVCAVCLFYYLLRRAGISANVSLVVVVLALLNRYVFGILLWNHFRIPEVLSFVFLIVLFLAMWSHHWLVFGLTLALGAFTRETTILMVPVAFVYLVERKELPLQWRQLTIAVIPGLLIFVLLRALVPVGGGMSLLEAFSTYSSKLYTPESLFRGLVNIFLPFTLVPLIHFRKTVKFFREQKYLFVYIALVYLSSLLGENEERLIAPTFVVFFMLLGTILDDVHAKKWTFTVLLTAAFLATPHHRIGIWLLPSNLWTQALSIGIAVCVTLYMFFLKYTNQTQEKTANPISEHSL